jgi:hypothetical protein
MGLTPGSGGSAVSDMDVGPDGTTMGWWFYFNSTATEVAWTGP